MKITSLLALLLPCALAPAQTQNIVYVPDNNAAVGTVNGFPFGNAGTRTQQIIPQSMIGSTPGLIQDLFVAPNITSGTTGANDSEVVYGDIEIRMGITQLTTLTNTWATNCTNPTTVYRGRLRVHFTRNVWTPLGMPASYLWLPLSPADNLVVDIITWSIVDRGVVPTGYCMSVHSGGLSRAYLINYGTTLSATSAGVDTYGVKLGFLFSDGNFVGHGGGCPGSSTLAPTIGVAPGTWPQLGSVLDVRLSQGPIGIGAALVLGFNTQTIAGLPLPLDLVLFGAPGCFAWHDSVATLPVVPTNATGDASQLIPIPNSAGLMSLRVYGTWLCIDPLANSLGATTSGYGTIIIGT